MPRLQRPEFGLQLLESVFSQSSPTSCQGQGSELITLFSFPMQTLVVVPVYRSLHTYCTGVTRLPQALLCHLLLH